MLGAFVSTAAELKDGDTAILYSDTDITDRSTLRPDRYIPFQFKKVGINNIRFLAPRPAKGVSKDPVGDFKKNVLDQKPSIIFLYYGYQGILNQVSLESLEPHLVAMVDQAKMAGIPVQLMTHLPHINRRYTAHNDVLLRWNEIIKRIANEKVCEVLDLYQLTHDALTWRNPEATGDFKPAYDRHQRSLSIFGGMIEQEAIVKAMGLPPGIERNVLEQMQTPDSSGYTVRFGDTYEAMMSLDTYTKLRSIPFSEKQRIVAETTEEIATLIDAAGVK